MTKLDQATVVFAQELIKAQGFPELRKVRRRLIREVGLTEPGANTYFYKIKKKFSK